MKAPKEVTHRWERTLARYFSAAGVPVKWDSLKHRFVGIRRHSIARINPSQKTETRENQWKYMPTRIGDLERRGSENVIMLVTSQRYGDEVEDSFVVMRLGTFTPIFKAFIDSDRERWIGE